jgi:hypothetical protein
VCVCVCVCVSVYTCVCVCVCVCVYEVIYKILWKFPQTFLEPSLPGSCLQGVVQDKAEKVGANSVKFLSQMPALSPAI